MVLIDLHTPLESQNGFDNGGISAGVQAQSLPGSTGCFRCSSSWPALRSSDSLVGDRADQRAGLPRRSGRHSRALPAPGSCRAQGSDFVP